MAIASPDVAVLIVGGGPVGLAARALLRRWRVPSLLVEKRSELSSFPRSRLVNVRSMEIFRQLGLAVEISGRAFRPEYGQIRFCDVLLGRDYAQAEMVGVKAPIRESPVTGVVTSQDRLEPILMAAPGGEVLFGVQLVDLAEEPDGIVASLVDHHSGESFQVRARYVIAADGAGSTVRQRLGIDTDGPGAIANFTTVVFDADLDLWSAHRPAGVYFTARGLFAPLYPEGGWAWFVVTPEDVELAQWRILLIEALASSPADVPSDLRILRLQHWTMTAFVAKQFRHGRILLAGDAAHAMPIAGGLGMNAGIADVYNLCWKLAGVLHGWAGPGLLSTYETERLPVAQQTLRQATANTQLMMQVQARRREQLLARRPRTTIELPWSDRYFAQLGLVLGTAYESAAVLADGSTPPMLSDPVTDYVPTGRPGHRMPHLWLRDGRSSLDALGEWFTLLTAHPDQSGELATLPWSLRHEACSEMQADLCGLGTSGALLVRPDGHIAARWSDHLPSDAALERALAVISCLRTSSRLAQRRHGEALLP